MTNSSRFTILCVDWDSTVSAIEGVDELAQRAGCGATIARLTELAMDGRLALEDVYAQRMAAIRPDCAALAWLAARYQATLLPGVAEAFARLQQAGVTLHIVSGGLRAAILPVAGLLGVSPEQVHAVEVFFDAQGDYLDYQRDAPLARSAGKAEICRHIAQPQQRLAMVGDGQTDSETRQAGAFFIGFGGVVTRETVKAQADYFAASWDDIVRFVLSQ